jgi:O-antigen/teichoic acid export membrane protein
VNSIIRAIRSDGIARGALTLVSGAAAGRAVGLLTVPILARLYTPADYGLAAVIMAAIAIALPFATLRYVVAVPLPRSDEVAAAVMKLCAALILGVGVLIGMALATAAAFGVDHLLDVPAAYYWAVPLGLVIAGMYEVAMLWGTRLKAFGRISRSQVAQTMAGEAVKVGFGVMGLKPIGLVIGQIVAQGSAGLLILGRDRARLFAAMRRAQPRRLGRVARLYAGFPAYRLPSHVLLQLSLQAPLLIIAHLYAAADAGSYAMAFMLIALPAGIIGQAVGSAYYGEIAAIGRRDPQRIRSLTAQTQLRLLAVAVPAGIVAVALGPYLTLLLGQRWGVAASLFVLMVPMAVTQILSAPVMQAVNVINRQDFYLKINICRCALIAALFGVSVWRGLGLTAFVAAYSAIMTGYYILLCVSIPRLLTGPGPART